MDRRSDHFVLGAEVSTSVLSAAVRGPENPTSDTTAVILTCGKETQWTKSVRRRCSSLNNLRAIGVADVKASELPVLLPSKRKRHAKLSNAKIFIATLNNDNAQFPNILLF
jgi:hypothetical protein